MERPINGGLSQENGVEQACLAETAVGAACYVQDAVQTKAKGDAVSFKKYGALAVIFSILHTFCLYGNTSGITYPFFMAGTLILIAFARKSDGLSLFKDRDGKSALNLFYIISLMLLSISKCTTANESLLFVDGFAIFLLMFSFMTHLYADTKQWDIISNLIGILLVVVSPLTNLPDPVLDCVECFRVGGAKVSSKNKQNLIAVLAGICVAVPLLSIVLALLASADAIFSDVLGKVFGLFKLPDNFWDVIGILWMLAWTLWLFYTVAKVLIKKGVTVENKNCGYNAIVAITFSSLLAIVYLLFSVIQIVFLFMGNMTLPAKYTFAEYAHEGFYQLLAVSVLNLAIVTVCKKLFSENNVLKAILTLIGVCTYIMIASSAFRMFMYIEAYHLTFLRVFVLWFLAVLAICLLFLIIGLYNDNFPVFKCCMIAMTAMYIVFVFANPDYHVAKYDLAYMKNSGGTDSVGRYESSMTRYLTEEISEDAVPAYVGNEELLKLYETGLSDKRGYYEKDYKEIRKFNFSRYRAWKILYSGK
ncbi:protein of unknown function [Butyrivibrio sp. ob235]|uniref:DUF4153 domain-containing protein n=1 Tax=Butyrivibrio sp. ob235 TaxID=1761780 RepID=UPI0008B68B61|nr:DUF4173 domain-containing protein [Butyrivibrio sp. ob235]SEL12028.1 protein of unknown function [Butyrivibrio sp. ob235]